MKRSMFTKRNIIWFAFWTTIVMSTLLAAEALSPPPLRQLPEKILIGYGHNCDHVRAAVEDGVNVVIWVFLNIVAVCDAEETNSLGTNDDATEVSSIERRQIEKKASSSKVKIQTDLDLERIGSLITELDQNGYSEVVHLVSFGGWNGPHLDPNLSAEEWYQGWRESIAAKVFHGVDWDLEGNDDLASPYNYFTKECLDKMGHISRLMKEGKLLFL